MSIRSRYRKAILAVISLAASSGLCLVTLEGGLRLTGAQPDFFFQLDPQVGTIHIPGKAGWHVFEGGRQYVEINAHGDPRRRSTDGGIAGRMGCPAGPRPGSGALPAPGP